MARAPPASRAQISDHLERIRSGGRIWPRTAAGEELSAVLTRRRAVRTAPPDGAAGGMAAAARNGPPGSREGQTSVCWSGPERRRADGEAVRGEIDRGR